MNINDHSFAKTMHLNSTHALPPTDLGEEPLIRYLNQILIDAVLLGISDLHFEPYENSYRIRSRKDGILHETARLPLKLAPRLTSRLKILSNLDISERRLPQDGRFKIDDISELKGIDFRISSCPTLFGEKIVIRILEFLSKKFNIDDLGLEGFQKELLLNHLQKPQGLILVTGPTGSGKTRTLYSSINLLNSINRNIISCEDPIEIYLPGINQVNVNLKAGLTFANALRSFLRQDPDVIMIGEIRDLETASIAIQAAQTGHLVLSTVHTNSAVETINRLLHMGIPPYQLATSCSLVIAQRLIRLLCSHCKITSLLPQQFSPNLEPNQCKHCKLGYSGRTAIYECMPISTEIQNLILNNASVIELKHLAVKEGMWDLRRSALHKVELGISSLEEVYRVVG